MLLTMGHSLSIHYKKAVYNDTVVQRFAEWPLKMLLIDPIPEETYAWFFRAHSE